VGHFHDFGLRNDSTIEIGQAWHNVFAQAIRTP